MAFNPLTNNTLSGFNYNSVNASVAYIQDGTGALRPLNTSYVNALTGSYCVSGCGISFGTGYANTIFASGTSWY